MVNINKYEPNIENIHKYLGIFVKYLSILSNIDQYCAI